MELNKIYHCRTTKTGPTRPVTVRLTHDLKTKELVVDLICAGAPWTHFSRISVHIQMSPYIPRNMAYIDTNNCPWAEEFLKDNNLAEDLSIDELASRFYISKYHMMRRFRAETGYTIHAYLVGKRLALAREQIAAGTPVLQASADCGFGDYSAFCRAYKRRFGMPPSSARSER